MPIPVHADAHGASILLHIIVNTCTFCSCYYYLLTAVFSAAKSLYVTIILNSTLIVSVFYICAM